MSEIFVAFVAVFGIMFLGMTVVEFVRMGKDDESISGEM